MKLQVAEKIFFWKMRGILTMFQYLILKERPCSTYQCNKIVMYIAQVVISHQFA